MMIIIIVNIKNVNTRTKKLMTSFLRDNSIDLKLSMKQLLFLGVCVWNWKKKTKRRNLYKSGKKLAVKRRRG